MANQNKPSIVFAHGLWADGSCFQKLIPALQADGHEVMCSQHGLDSLKGDVECVTRCFGRVSAPVVLVGHSYGGTLITHAGTDSRVAALVYIAALAPDETETSQSLQQKFPVTEVFSHIEVADGRIWLKQPDGIGCFAGDVPEAVAVGRCVLAGHQPEVAADLLVAREAPDVIDPGHHRFGRAHPHARDRLQQRHRRAGLRDLVELRLLGQEPGFQLLQLRFEGLVLRQGRVVELLAFVQPFCQRLLHD